MRTPTFTCYRRVDNCLKHDRAASDYISEPTEEMKSSTGEIVKFPKEVIAITDMIHSTGKDARTLNREQIIRLVIDIFVHKTVKLEYKPKPAPVKEVAKPELKSEDKVESTACPPVKQAEPVTQDEPVKKARAPRKVEERLTEPTTEATSPILTGPKLKMDIAVPLFSLISTAYQLIDIQCKNIPVAAQWQVSLDKILTELQTVSLK